MNMVAVTVIFIISIRRRLERCVGVHNHPALRLVLLSEPRDEGVRSDPDMMQGRSIAERGVEKR